VLLWLVAFIAEGNAKFQIQISENKDMFACLYFHPSIHSIFVKLLVEKVLGLLPASTFFAGFSLHSKPQWVLSNGETDIRLLFTPFGGPTLLFISNSFFFNYMNYLIGICDSCLFDYAELT
jgi:hypothetical protein